MEKYELLNTFLRPLDKVVDANIKLLKKMNVYEPVRDFTFRKIMNNMRKKFKKMHKLKVLGLENIPGSGGAVIASNHQSWLDAQVLGVSTDRFIHFIAKSELYNWPLLCHFIEFAQSYSINRTGDKDGISNVVNGLKSGELVAIFPEGTIPGEEDIPRSAVEKDTGLLRGKTGMIRMAIAAKVPIIPCGITGTGRAFPPEAYPRMEKFQLSPKPYPVTIRFGKPIYFKEYYNKRLSKETLRKLAKKVMLAISALVDHSQNYVPIEVPITDQLPKYKKVGVLLLHGFTSSLKTVDGLIPYLKKHNIPYSMPVLRGHGTEYTDMVGTTARDWYDDAEDALLELSKKVDKVIIAGLSMGGLVAIDLGIHHSKKVAAVVSIAAALKFADPLSGLTPVLSKVIKFWPSPNAYNSKECAKANRNYPKFSTEAFGSLYAYSQEIEAKLPKLKVPILVLQSKKDQIVAPKAGQIIYDNVGSAHREITWFEKSGHEMMQDLERRKVFDEIEKYILRFIA